MKRTLLEVTGGLAALVVLVSFHHQIARLKQQNHDVHELRQLVDATVAKAGSKQDLDDLRRTMLGQLEQRLQDLDARLQQAAAGTNTANALEGELRRARAEVNTLRDQVQSDVRQTKALVDAYIDEVRAKEKNADLKLHATQNAISALAGQMVRRPAELTRTMLLPTVQLNGDDTVGSGTLVFSGTNSKTGATESYVLTSHHVVRNILADKPSASQGGFDVTIYLPEGKVQVKGSMVASQPRIDAALVKLHTDRRFPHVANVLPRNPLRQIRVWDPVCAVGCPLGNDPVPSHGEVSSLSNDLNGANYWMINAPTYFGNSGGGVYLAGSSQLIGVFSKIYTHGRGNPVVVPHMGLCTPIEAIYEWLAQEKLDHLLQSVEVQLPDLEALAAPPR